MEGNSWAKTLLAKNEAAARAVVILLKVFMMNVRFDVSPGVADWAKENA
jgi:hypothetical protein